MFRRFSVNFAIFSLMLDILCAYIALAAAEALRPAAAALPIVLSLTDYQIPVAWRVLMPFLWAGTLLLTSVYERSSIYRVVDETAVVLFASSVAALLCAGLFYLLSPDFSRALFVMFVGINVVLLLSWRLVMRIVFRLRGSMPAERQVLVIGTGRAGQQVGAMLGRHEWMGLRLVGFLETDSPGTTLPTLAGETFSQHTDSDLQLTMTKVLGRLPQLKDVIQRQEIDDVVIALPQRAYGQVNQLILALHDLPVQVRVVPDYFSLALYRAKAEDFGGLPMINLKDPAFSNFQRLLKRLFDLLLGMALVAVALPVYALVAAAIKLDSDGPIFFLQERVGENGRIFQMYKFRTMIPDAEAMQEEVNQVTEDGELIHKRPDDPRVTRVGRFLRRTSLDEMPQLFNVLLGDMSLVGPRPEMPWVLEQYEPWQHKRFAVPQGITGWWQINGRSERMMHLHTEDDLYYIQNYSLWMDIYILLKTPLVVMKGKGAY